MGCFQNTCVFVLLYRLINIVVITVQPGIIEVITVFHALIEKTKKLLTQVDQGYSDAFCFQRCECNGSVYVAARCSVFSDRSTPQCSQDR